MKKKELEKIVNTILLAHGFRKKSLTWYRERQDALNVINLQKSAYGNQYYLNICFNPAGIPIDDSPSPKEHKCPIRIRFEAAFPNEQEKFNSIFNLEKDEIQNPAMLCEIWPSPPSGCGQSFVEGVRHQVIRHHDQLLTHAPYHRLANAQRREPGNHT